MFGCHESDLPCLRGVQFYRGHKPSSSFLRTTTCLRGVQFYRGHKPIRPEGGLEAGLRGVQFYRGHKLFHGFFCRVILFERSAVL